MACAAVSVSVGTLPLGGVAAANNLVQASLTTCVTQPESASASVAKLAIVGVCTLLSGPRIASPHPPVARLTKLGTLPAAILRPSALPLIASPSTNCVWVQTDATVVISLTTTLGGVALPSTLTSAMAGLSAPVVFAEDRPPF